MKRKIMITVCSFLILSVLAGCQLALVNTGTNVYDDRLVGVFITTEYLDLLDFEGYLNDNLSSFQGGEITVSGNDQKYQGRIYATLTTRTLTNEKTGDLTEMEEYAFEDIEGFAFFSPTVPATNKGDSYSATVTDDAISDVHTSINYGDDKKSISLEGTIYASPSNLMHTYYFNPVYQSSDSSVYVSSGSGFMVSNESYSEGSVYSQTLDATTTVTENGKAEMESISVTVSISIMMPPERISVLQMDAGSKLLSRTEYEPGALPEAFIPEPGTDYFIVEINKRDEAGNLKISRTIYGRDAENIESFSAGKDGICVKNWSQIKWDKPSVLNRG